MYSASREKSFSFAVKIVRLSKVLSESHEYALASQIVRSGTSIGANIEEAEAAQTKKDFIAKMSIASKEARETLYWIRLLTESEVIKFDFKTLKSDCEELVRILTSIVKTSQQNLYTNQ
jgi:four helix bundle protein